MNYSRWRPERLLVQLTQLVFWLANVSTSEIQGRLSLHYDQVQLGTVNRVWEYWKRWVLPHGDHIGCRRCCSISLRAAPNLSSICFSFFPVNPLFCLTGLRFVCISNLRISEGTCFHTDVKTPTSDKFAHLNRSEFTSLHASAFKLNIRFWQNFVNLHSCSSPPTPLSSLFALLEAWNHNPAG